MTRMAMIHLMSLMTRVPGVRDVSIQAKEVHAQNQLLGGIR